MKAQYLWLTFLDKKIKKVISNLEKGCGEIQHQWYLFEWSLHNWDHVIRLLSEIIHMYFIFCLFSWINVWNIYKFKFPSQGDRIFFKKNEVFLQFHQITLIQFLPKLICQNFHRYKTSRGNGVSLATWAGCMNSLCFMINSLQVRNIYFSVFLTEDKYSNNKVCVKTLERILFFDF